MPILLTSIGLSSKLSQDKFRDISKNLLNKTVSIVTTAADGKEQNKYAQLALNQFKDMGFNKIEFVDLESEPYYDFSSTGILYVMGGNTFKLMYYVLISNLKDSINNLLEREEIYIGVSAGSIILGSTILTASEILEDKNDIFLDKYEGLGFAPFAIVPHYNTSLEEKIQLFERNYKIEVKRISDDEYILL